MLIVEILHLNFAIKRQFYLPNVRAAMESSKIDIELKYSKEQQKKK